MSRRQSQRVDEQANLRSSIPAGRASYAERTPRRSISRTNERAAPSSVDTGRRSSIYGKLDARSVEKGDLKRFLDMIVSYLATHQYPHQVSTKSLHTSKSTYDFISISQFLLQKLDPTFTTFTKMEEELPTILKTFGYPFSISRSAFSAIGATNHWPVLMHALGWIVEALIATEPSGAGNVMNRDEETGRVCPGSVAVKCYTGFMSGNEEESNEIKQERLESLHHKTGRLRQQKMMARQNNEARQSEILAMRSSNPVAEARRRTAELRNGLLETLDIYEKEIEADRIADLKMSAKEDELLNNTQLAAERRQEVEQVKARVAAQPISMEEMQGMLQERETRKKQLDASRKALDELSQALLQKDAQVQAAITALHRAQDVFNEQACMLKLIPETSKRADGINFELQLLEGPDSGLLQVNLDLKQTIKPALKALADHYKEKGVSIRRQLGEVEDANYKAKLKVAEVEATTKEKQAQLDALQDLESRLMEEEEHAVATRKAQIEQKKQEFLYNCRFEVQEVNQLNERAGQELVEARKELDQVLMLGQAEEAEQLRRVKELEEKMVQYLRALNKRAHESHAVIAEYMSQVEAEDARPKGALRDISNLLQQQQMFLSKPPTMEPSVEALGPKGVPLTPRPSALKKAAADFGPEDMSMSPIPRRSVLMRSSAASAAADMSAVQTPRS